MISKSELAKIAAYDTKGLICVHEELITERMILDKDMSEFLHLNEQTMSYDVSKYEDIWKVYHKMSAAYSELIQVLTLTEFYMKRYSLI